MFVDYYSLLDIEETASAEAIKAAFRKQAIKWHPDRNPGKDTTIQMQRINEAYLILKDIEARQKFDIEYQKFKSDKKKESDTKVQTDPSGESTSEKENTHNYKSNDYSEYSFNDETLKNWMNNARRQSVSLAKQTIEDFKGMVAVGIKEGVKASGQALVSQIVISVIIVIIIAISKSCNQ